MKKTKTRFITALIGTLAIGGIILIGGAVGAVEHGTWSLGKGFMLAVFGLALVGIGTYISNIYNEEE